MPLNPRHIEISQDRRRLDLEWSDGQRDSVLAWQLYDHADEALDPVSGQRRHGALALDAGLGIAEASADGGDLRLRFSPNGERRTLPLARLRARDARAAPAPAPWLTPERLAGAPPAPLAAYLADDAALGETLARVLRDGLAFLNGAGEAPGVVERVTARFGFVRETNYGRVFDVRSEPRPSNLAYTTAGLDLHTDNPYRDPTPSLQLLHVLKADATGGASLFVDGFAHAEALRREAPEAFETLRGQAVRFAYQAPDGARFTAQAPILETAPCGAIRAIRLNHRSLVPLSLPTEAAQAWYEAYLAFYRRLHAPGAALQRRLAPGDVVIFDNRRILHGRSAYSEAAFETQRWLQGCYADRDGLEAALTRLG